MRTLARRGRCEARERGVLPQSCGIQEHGFYARSRENRPGLKYCTSSCGEEPGSISVGRIYGDAQVAEKLDGGYVLKSDRQDLTGEEIWRTYILLTRVEAAFRAMKSPLAERPIFHQLEHRTQTHIFFCVLAYHLLVAIEKRFLDRGTHTSWWTLRQQLSTHQVITVVLPTGDGRVLKIRKGTTPEPTHREIYSTLKIPMEVMKPMKTWQEVSS